jgi:uncharacterized protein (DUF58 family)
MRLWLFHRVLRLDRWIRSRFTPVGRMFLASLIAVGLFAINPRATLAWQLAILLVAVLVAATLWAPLFRPRLGLTRSLPRFATAGSPLRYSLLVENRGSWLLRGLEVCDFVRAVRPTEPQIRAVDGDEGGEGWFDRRIGYMRFTRALAVLEGARCRNVSVPDLAAGAREHVSVELTPLRRGYLQLAGVQLRRADPLGVFHAIARVPCAERLLVLPQRYPVSWSGAGGTMQRPRHGQSRSRTTGAGADFARLREYRPRDPLRHIHWRAWARLGEPVVKEFHEESPSRNALVLDTFAPPGCSPAAFDEAVSVAASFVADSSWRSGRLDLLFAGETTVHLGQGSEGEGVGRMLEALACVELARTQGFAALADAVMHRLGGFSACVLVLLDWDTLRQELARAVLAARVATLVLVVARDANARLQAAPLPGLDPRCARGVAPGDGARVLANLALSAPAPLDAVVNA